MQTQFTGLLDSEESSQRETDLHKALAWNGGVELGSVPL